MRISEMRKALILLVLTPVAGFALQARAETITLGTAANYAVLSGAAVANTGGSVISGGDVGAGAALTGFPPGSIQGSYTTDNGPDATTIQAQADFTTAYTEAAGLTPTTNLTGQDLGGMTLTPGVYSFASSAFLTTGTLTLNDEGNPDALFVFQMGSTLITAANTVVTTINGGSTPGDNVFWKVGSSATLGANTAFEGHILAYAAITLGNEATILDGSALAGAAVTLDTNTINNNFAPATGGLGSIVPEPSLLWSLPALLVVFGLVRRMRAKKSLA